MEIKHLEKLLKKDGKTVFDPQEVKQLKKFGDNYFVLGFIKESVPFMTVFGSDFIERVTFKDFDSKFQNYTVNDITEVRGSYTNERSLFVVIGHTMQIAGNHSNSVCLLFSFETKNKKSELKCLDTYHGKDQSQGLKVVSRNNFEIVYLESLVTSSHFSRIGILKICPKNNKLVPHLDPTTLPESIESFDSTVNRIYTLSESHEIGGPDIIKTTHLSFQIIPRHKLKKEKFRLPSLSIKLSEVNAKSCPSLHIMSSHSAGAVQNWICFGYQIQGLSSEGKILVNFHGQKTFRYTSLGRNKDSSFACGFLLDVESNVVGIIGTNLSTKTSATLEISGNLKSVFALRQNRDKVFTMAVHQRKSEMPDPLGAGVHIYEVE